MFLPLHQSKDQFQPLLLGDQTHLHGCPGNQQHRKPAKKRLVKRNICLLPLLFYYTFSFYIFKGKEKKKWKDVPKCEGRIQKRIKSKKAHIQGCVCLEKILRLKKRNQDT